MAAILTDGWTIRDRAQVIQASKGGRVKELVPRWKAVRNASTDSGKGWERLSKAPALFNLDDLKKELKKQQENHGT